MTNSIINTEVIRDFYEEFCKDENLPISETDFKTFVTYLEIDFFDWLQRNLNSFKNKVETDEDASEANKSTPKNKTIQKTVKGDKQLDIKQLSLLGALKAEKHEKRIESILQDTLKSMGLAIINVNLLRRTIGSNLSLELSQVERNLLIDFGEFGYHLPNFDFVIYEPETCKVVAVLSSKVTLRERVAQTGYWKMKLLSGKITKHIKVFFITLDEDGTLTIKKPAKKGRAIVEIDTDGCYIMNNNDIEESEKVKTFSKFMHDLKMLIKS